MEKTFIMVKPDGVQRSFIGEVIKRFESKGYKLLGLKLMNITPELAGRHYGEHQGKAFYQKLVDFITSGPVVAMVWEGKSVIKGARTIMGATNPVEAVPGSIRGDLALDISMNIVHGSDSLESAQREIQLFFKNDELLDYTKCNSEWLQE